MSKRIQKNTRFAVLIIAVFIFVTKIEFIQAEEFVGGASMYLYEYAIELYRKGDFEDAVGQLKKALLANPSNLEAKKFLQKILTERQIKEEPISFREEESKTDILSKQLLQTQEESRAYQREIKSIVGVSSSKDNELLEFKKQLESENELLVQKEKELRTSLKDKETKISQLNNQLVQLWEELQSYQDRFKAMKKEEPSQKGLEKLKSDYENRLKLLDDEIKTKDSKIKETISERDLLLEEDRKLRRRQLAKIEELIKSIAEVLPQNVIGKDSVTAEERKLRRLQLAKIEELIKSIQEVISESSIGERPSHN